MSYGSLSASIVNHFNKVSYTLDGKTYKDIKIFKTDPKNESIAPAVYVNENKQRMENMNPPGVSSSKVIAKINGNPMEYGQYNDAFYGLYYVNSTLYMDGKQLSGTSDTALNKLHHRYYPCFCVKTDGTVNIRWFTKDNLATALPYCNSIIGSAHPLVFNSMSVFESVVKDDVEGIRIADWSQLDNTDYHFNNGICGGTAAYSANRTFLGHKADGSFFMVCFDVSGIDLRSGAKLMVDLGCDYAVSMDGGGAVKMRVADNYTNGYPSGQMTSGGTEYYGTAVCAYLK